MQKTRLSLFYLAGCTLFGGLAFFTIPNLSWRLFGSAGDYNEVMVRFVGLMLMAVGIIVTQVIRLDQLYLTAQIGRTLTLASLIWFYVRYGDPFMMVLFCIVGLGFLLTACWTEELCRSDCPI